MSNAIPAGGPPAEKSPHDRSCFEQTVSLDPGTPEKFTADLAQRIANECVLPVGTVVNVLAHANYAEMVFAWRMNEARRKLDDMENSLASAKLQASRAEPAADNAQGQPRPAVRQSRGRSPA